MSIVCIIACMLMCGHASPHLRCTMLYIELQFWCLARLYGLASGSGAPLHVSLHYARLCGLAAGSGAPHCPPLHCLGSHHHCSLTQRQSKTFSVSSPTPLSYHDTQEDVTITFRIKLSVIFLFQSLNLRAL